MGLALLLSWTEKCLVEHLCRTNGDAEIPNQLSVVCPMYHHVDHGTTE